MRASLFRTAEPPAPNRLLTVLVAGGDATDHTIAEILERAGHRAMIVDDGEAVLDALDTCSYDIVFMHVGTPAMSGLETVKLYRFLSLDRRHVPIVAILADATDEMQRRCRDAGMDACLAMPVERDRLLDLLPTLIGTGANAATVSNADEAAVEAIDPHTLGALEDLGGLAFADDLAAQFLDDSSDIVGALAAAMDAGDVRLFDERLYQLRGGAANIGAHGVHAMCSSWGKTAAENLASREHPRFEKLRAECDRARLALQARLFEHVSALRLAESGAIR